MTFKYRLKKQQADKPYQPTFLEGLKTNLSEKLRENDIKKPKTIRTLQVKGTRGKEK